MQHSPSWKTDSSSAGQGINYLTKCKIPDDGQRNCPKHVEFYSKKIEKLVHLVGFVIRIYHDAH